ncbi:hypothetical protein TREPR_2831 [Treponema primitia ZAS-2]|uniref:Uncharacterized protein n=1 Tax=Treponema primitia (strain ATCC BAA-887 / DSM 12427 / ZAS-2) TaxID=545694 RepID=F5YPW0_TREPZ|nr:hypothetical protein [Treponema primitia]AEF85097.1 hypothetical protein TREPR_2831 [Treponema primitia ZAS-2]
MSEGKVKAQDKVFCFAYIGGTFLKKIICIIFIGFAVISLFAEEPKKFASGTFFGGPNWYKDTLNTDRTEAGGAAIGVDVNFVSKPGLAVSIGGFDRFQNNYGSWPVVEVGMGYSMNYIENVSIDAFLMFIPDIFIGNTSIGPKFRFTHWFRDIGINIQVLHYIPYTYDWGNMTQLRFGISVRI